MRRVVVTGIGVVSPLGNDPETLFTALAEGPAAQFESQLRATPDGMTMWAVWTEEGEGLGVTNAMFRRTP